MEEKNEKRAFACIIEFSAFEPDEFSKLYTPLRQKMLEGMSLERRAKMQSAAAELAYLAAARAALDGGLLGANEAGDAEKGFIDKLKKRFEYAYDKNGKPVLSGAYMSLSHTSGAALAVIAPFPVGADIERERRVSARIAKRIMNAAEYEAYSSLPEEEKNARIFECWTAKESFLKLTGEGISAGLSRLCYDGENAEVRREATGERAIEARLDTASIAEDAKLFACICSHKKPKLELLRFFRAHEAAGFILREGYPPRLSRED